MLVRLGSISRSLEAGSGKAVEGQPGPPGSCECLHMFAIGLPAHAGPGCKVRLFAVTSQCGVPALHMAGGRPELAGKPRKLRDGLL